MGWYLLRLAWFAAPWSLVAGAVAWVWLRFRTIGTSPPPFDESTERGLVWALLLTAVFIGVLSPALVRAERFIFPTYFVIGAVGVVAAIRTVGGVRSLAVRADRYACAPDCGVDGDVPAQPGEQGPSLRAGHSVVRGMSPRVQCVTP